MHHIGNDKSSVFAYTAFVCISGRINIHCQLSSDGGTSAAVSSLFLSDFKLESAGKYTTDL